MRVAFIGDVHGHATAFMKLLRRLEAHGVDEIVQVGDLVDRGPASIECVRIARTWTFTARGAAKRAPKQKQIKVVNGNHDNNYLYGRRHWQMPTRGFFPRFTEKDVGENLSKADINWIASLPYFIEIPGLKVTAVHGGIPHEWNGPLPTDRRSGFFMTRCGYIGKNGEYLKPGGYSKKFWADDYDGRYGLVVFGHTSFRDITYFKHAVGVDCSKYGNIGAVVISNEDANPITEFYEKTYSSSYTSYGSSSKSSKSYYGSGSKSSKSYYGSGGSKSWRSSKPSSSKTLSNKDFDVLVEQFEEASEPRSSQKVRDCGLCGDIFGPDEKQVPCSMFPGEVFHQDCVENACLNSDDKFGF